jgi:phosphoglycolate phosphatase
MVSGLLQEECGDPAAEIAEFRARYAECTTPKSSLYTGVEGGLQKLRSAGFKLAICSNKPQNLCDNVLRDVGLMPLFSAVVGGGPGRPPKPHPFLLERALEQLGSAPSECFFVGDSELDHAIAAAVGMPFLFLNHGYAEEGWDRSLLVQFDQFADLVTHISTARQTFRARRRAA